MVMVAARANRRIVKLLNLVFRLDQRDRFERSEAGNLENDDQWCQGIVRVIVGGKTPLGERQLYQMAMIYHHADIGRSIQALSMARNAHVAGHEGAAHLIAAITDSLLIRKGLPQKYGTQYRLDRRTGQWMLAPIDEGTSDSERMTLGLPPRAQIKVEMESWRIEPDTSAVEQAA